MSFDPEAFKHTEIDDSMDTEIIPPDEGVYTAKVDRWNIEGGTSQNGFNWARLDVTWELDDADGSQQQKTGRDKLTGRQSIFLDLTEDGQIDTGKGKNVQLGRLREALGLNEGKFAFDMLDGQQAQVLTENRETQNGNMVTNIRKVASLSENVK